MCNIKLQAATEEKNKIGARYELENTNKKQVILSSFPKASSKKSIVIYYTDACVCMYLCPLLASLVFSWAGGMSCWTEENLIETNMANVINLNALEMRVFKK